MSKMQILVQCPCNHKDFMCLKLFTKLPLSEQETEAAAATGVKYFKIVAEGSHLLQFAVNYPFV